MVECKAAPLRSAYDRVVLEHAPVFVGVATIALEECIFGVANSVEWRNVTLAVALEMLGPCSPSSNNLSTETYVR